MQKSSKIQYIAIALCIGAVVMLSVLGLKTSVDVVGKTETTSTVDEVSELIAHSNEQGLQDYITRVIQKEKLSSEEIQKATRAFQFLYDADKLTVDQKVQFAQIRMDNASSNEDVMFGITTLLDVIKVDSNNIAALEVLGERSIQSGQLEKGRKRYQKLLSLQPENKEYQEKLKFLDAELSK